MTQGEYASRPMYRASRRRLLRDATFVSLGIIAASCAPVASGSSKSSACGLAALRAAARASGDSAGRLPVQAYSSATRMGFCNGRTTLPARI